MRGVLSEVPNGPLLVLGVVVEGLLDHGIVVRGDVAHYRRGDTEDHLLLIGNGHRIGLALPVLHAGVDELSSHGQREVGVVDDGHEVRRIEHRRVGGAAR
jgi:hypothetical protein